MRRDFIQAAQAFQELTQWALAWIEDIHALEKINGERVKAIGSPSEFQQQQLLLEAQLLSMMKKCTEQLAAPKLHNRQKKVLKSLNKNWNGLTLFVSDPRIPMHNNVAENALRLLALGRVNFYGSRAEWSGHLSAICMSICKTAEKHGLNPQAYLEFYFWAYANHDPTKPIDIEPLLPWNISDEVITEFNMRKPDRKIS